ncbi:MAG: autotransporter outer membrane beta-barrel domain-containing protein [Acidaminococcaceae bacterium]|nr:autotransporter outer membrane beta-barrel domain-containing protein [Acidaminococcaceae bacterium]
MSKKMLKRSLALGALMAFVITGSAMADSVSINESSDTGLRGIDYSDTPGLDLTGISSVTVSNTGTGGATGVNLENKSSATLGEITITSTSANANGFGFRLIYGSEVKDGVTSISGNTVVVNGNANITANGGDYAQGIYSQYSDVTFEKNVTINATSTGDHAYAVRMLGDTDSETTKYTNSKIVFNGDLTEFNVKGNKYAWGIVASGANEGGGIYFNGGEVEVEVEANEQAVGIHTQYGTSALAASEQTSIAVTSTSTNGSAYGISAGKYAGSAGTVDFDGNVKVVASGSTAYGIEAEEGASINLGSTGKNVSITATSTSGKARGVHAENGAVVELGESNIDVKSQSGAAIGVYGKLGSEVIMGQTHITSESESGNAYGVYMFTGGKVEFHGDLDIDTTAGGNDAYGLISQKGGNIIIDNSNASVNLDVTGSGSNVFGIQAYTNEAGKSDISIIADELNVNVEATGDGQEAIGISAQGYLTNVEGSNVSIEANKTTITATSKDDGKTYAVMAMSNSKLSINSDLEATGSSVIYTRGNAKTYINSDENGNALGNKVILNGDINYGKSSTGGEDEVIDATVIVNLEGNESEFNGAIIATDGNGNVSTELQEKVSTGTTLGLYNGATWNVTKDSFVNTMNGTDGNVVLTTSIDGSSVTATKVDISTNNNANLTVSGDEELTKAIEDGTVTNVDDALNALKTAVEISDTDNSKEIATVKTAEGKILGSYVLTENGAELQESSKSAAVSEAGMNLKAHWRAHMNDMNKRMGELRMANGETGVWTRMVRGETEYEGAKMQYNQYQLGYDEKLSVDKRWTVGAAVTFAEGDSSYGQGSSEDKSTAFAIYGTKLNNDGTFVDLIARYARLESDIEDSVYEKGEYDTNGMSVSAEFGKRIQQGKGLWIEPQVELTYGTVDSATVKFADGSVANYGDMDSLIGRVGFRLGKDIERGNVYARASYLYDFDGESETAFSNGTVSGKPIEEDFGGGWWEVGVGANINLSKATYIYADVEKTFGGEVDTNWQWNLGVRYSF